MKQFKIILISFILSILSLFIYFLIFNSILFGDVVIFKYALHPFNIVQKEPTIWNFIKFLSTFDFVFSCFIIIHSIVKRLFFKEIDRTKKHFESYKSNNLNNNKASFNYKLISNQNLNLTIGFDSNKNLITIPEKSLYQNFLITGTIGSGKTSSAMYPFTKQLIEYKSNITEDKIGMLILDVKGNYYSKVFEYAKSCKRENDIIVIDLSGKTKYNPLDKPNIHSSVLADRLKTILELFSPNNSEDFWLDKVQQILTEAIKLCRLYNSGYVDFIELHNLVFDKEYYLDKVTFLKEKFLNNNLSKEEIFNLLSCLNFFEKEFYCLDERTISILRSEISRITSLFVSDYQIKSTFCPKREDINFFGFSDLINNGKIVVLNMNIAEYKNLSKLIATYLKLDFQTEVISRLKNKNANILNLYSLNTTRPVCFISDEFQEYITESDSNFFAQSREAKCINIISTQSYTSLLNALNSEASVKVIIQNLVNKLWFRNDDIFTIEEAQKQIGREDKEKISKTISENAKETNYNYFFHKFLSKDSNISESVNSYTQTDFVYDTNFFTRNLETFSALAFLSNGDSILKPQKLNLIPYFKEDFYEKN